MLMLQARRPHTSCLHCACARSALLPIPVLNMQNLRWPRPNFLSTGACRCALSFSRTTFVATPPYVDVLRTCARGFCGDTAPIPAHLAPCAAHPGPRTPGPSFAYAVSPRHKNLVRTGLVRPGAPRRHSRGRLKRPITCRSESTVAIRNTSSDDDEFVVVFLVRRANAWRWRTGKEASGRTLRRG